jgi:energy-coupling factor transporter ATP-binding protein EcfA2
MPVYEDLLEWLDGRPAWQRDAIRRLARGDILPEGVSTLTAFALAEAGGPAVEPGPMPVEPADLPRDYVAGPDVRLTGIRATANLNAIAAGSELEFATAGLTVVYGDNGSGKSGYVRLLKEVCRARSRTGAILPDVFVAPQGRPHARVRYDLEGVANDLDWQPGAAIPVELARVSVFDRACASVYVTAESEVAYRPFGLDLLDGLARAAQAVQGQLERDRSRLVSVAPAPPAELATKEPISSFWPLSARTDRSLIERIEAASPELTAEIVATDRALATEDPAARARAARAVRTAVDRARRRLDELNATVSDDHIAALVEAAVAARRAQSALETLTRDTLATEVLGGVGGDAWHDLWAAAEAYSLTSAYPDHEFPNVEPGARCVLCGQTLDQVASARLLGLREYVRDQLGTIARQARLELEDGSRPFRDVEGSRTADDELVAALAEAAPSVARVAGEALNAARMRASTVLESIGDDREPGPLDLEDPPDIGSLSAEVTGLDEDIRLLDLAANPEEAEALRARQAELKATGWAAQNREALLGEIERLRLAEAYRLAIATCDTHAITNENNELTRRYVTAALQDDVARELANLNADRVRVTLAWRGHRAVALHHFELRGSAHPTARVDDVVSEGEFGALAVAAFLAEVRQQAGRSTIVLDDPVSSLDHLFRSRVADRLAAEAIERPVVVFTHDLVFLHDLEGAADGSGAAIQIRHLRVNRAGVGQPVEGSPWRGMSVEDRIRELRTSLDRVRALDAEGDPGIYESAVRDWYGLLREAWERGVEDTLFGGAILRYRHDVQTRRLLDKRVWLVDEADITELDRGMSRSSAGLRGHDQPQAVNAPVPTPDEMERDLAALERWVQDLNARRRADRRAGATGQTQ